MDKITAVENSYRHSGDAIVFYDEGNDTIWVCFGGTAIRGHEIQFLDCSKADIGEDVENYDGDVLPGSFDVYFRIPEKIDFWSIPTRFREGELVEVIAQ